MGMPEGKLNPTGSSPVRSGAWRLNAEYAKIWPNITVKKTPPPDSKEWEGKPDKLQYLSPNPGAGD